MVYNDIAYRLFTEVVVGGCGHHAALEDNVLAIE